MAASHSVFSCTFPESEESALPTVHVRTSLELEQTPNRFATDFEKDRAALRKVLLLRAGKQPALVSRVSLGKQLRCIEQVYTYWCPRSLRAARMQQYKMLPSKRKTLPQRITWPCPDVQLVFTGRASMPMAVRIPVPRPMAKVPQMQASSPSGQPKLPHAGLFRVTLFGSRAWWGQFT